MIDKFIFTKFINIKFFCLFVFYVLYLVYPNQAYSDTTQFSADLSQKIKQLIELSKTSQNKDISSPEDKSIAKAQQQSPQQINKVQISLDELLSLVFQHSIKSMLLKSQLSSVRSIYLSKLSEYDSQIYGTSSIINNNSDLLPAGIDNTKKYQATTGFKSTSIYGTTLDLQLSAGYGSQKLSQGSVNLNNPIPNTTSDANYQTSIAVTVSQSLTKNFLAKQYNKNLALANIEADSLKYNVYDQRVKFLYQIIEIFYQMKLLQSRYLSLKDLSSQTKELFRTGEILYDRGLLEQVDVLRLKSKVVIADDNQKLAHKELQNLWDNMINQIISQQDLVESLVGMDPMAINFSAKSLVDKFNLSCDFEINWDRLVDYKKLVSEYDVVRKSIEVQEHNLRSDISASIGYAIPGESDQLLQSVGDSIALDRGVIKLQLNYTKSLGNHRIKQKLSDLKTQSTGSRLNLQSFKTNRHAEIRSSCRDIVYQLDRKKSLDKIYTSQKKRADLEQARYRIAKTDVFTVIEATIDALNAQLSSTVLNYEIEKNLWKLMILLGDLEDDLYQWISQN